MPTHKNESPKTVVARDSANDQLSGLNIEELNLPKSIVTRLAKGVLPPNTQIQSNAMIGLTKSATLFVNYIASQANERAAAANRKTVNTDDVFTALEESEFSNWRQRLDGELKKYNEIIGQRKERVRSKETDGAPALKKIKRDKSSPNISTNNINGSRNKKDEKEQSVKEPIGVMNSTDLKTDEGDDEVDEDEDKDKDKDEDEDEDEDEEEEEDGDGDEEKDDGEGGEITDKDQVITESVDEALDNGEDSD